MLNDPLANALSTMKNAELKGKGTCIIKPSSKLIGGVLNLLKEKNTSPNMNLLMMEKQVYIK